MKESDELNINDNNSINNTNPENNETIIVKKPVKLDKDYLFLYKNDFVKNYNFKRRVNLNKTSPLKLYSDLTNQLDILSNVSPKFQERIAEEPLPIAIEGAKIKEKNPTITFIPLNEGTEDQFYCIDDQETVNNLKTFHRNHLQLINDMDKEYNTEENKTKYPVHNRIIQYAKKHAEFLSDPEAFDLLSGFPEYQINSTKSFADMPGPEFKDAEGNYSVDVKRWNKLMSETVFLEQAEECQDFFLNSYVPYAKKMKTGSLTPEDSEKYNIAYSMHLLKQKRYFEKITKYDHSNPDIAANKVCNDDHQFNMDWKGDRFGKQVLENTNTNLRLMDNGWPAADMTFLNQLMLMKKNIDNAVKGKGYTKDEVKAAKLIQKNMKTAYNNIINKPVLNPEDRMSKLEAIEKSVQDYCVFDQKYKTRIYGRDNFNLNNSSLSWLFEETKGREVFRTEIGRNKEYNTHVKTNVKTPINAITNQFGSGISPEDQEVLFSSPIYNSARPFPDNPLYANSFDIYGNEIDTKPILTGRNSVNTMECATDETGYKLYLSKVSKLSDHIEKINNNLSGDDDIGLQMREFLKSRTSDPLRRIAKGYNNYFLNYYTPFGLGIEAMSPEITGKSYDGSLRKHFEKWQHKLPIYNLFVECERQLQTFADYYEEKEKNGGSLSPEREKYYRQKVYDHTVNISPMYNKIIESVENPAIHEELKNDKVFQNAPFNIHPRAARGTRDLYSSLDAYKVGLENGWSLEDTALLATFYKIIVNNEFIAAGNCSNDLTSYETYDPPKYKSPEHKQQIKKMHDLYDEIKKHPLKSAEDREKYITAMNSLVEEGEKKDLLNQYQIEYYKQMAYHQFNHNINIGVGKAAAFHPESVKKGSERQLEIIMSDITAPRTDKWWSSESDYHEKLRKSCEELQNFMKAHPNKDAAADDIMDYAAGYLDKLDSVQHYSNIYQDKRSTASSIGGINRLKGAREIWNHAETEKDSLLKLVNSKSVEKFDNIDQLRKKIAENKKNKAADELKSMVAMPRDDAGKNRLAELAADVMLNRFATSESGGKAFTELGRELMKKEILNSSDFKSLMKSYLKTRDMTPSNMLNELQSDNVMRRIKGTSKKIKNVEDKAKEIKAKNDVKKRKAIEKINSKINENGNNHNMGI